MRCEAEAGDEQHTGGPTADRMPGESCDQHGELNRGGDDEVYVEPDQPGILRSTADHA
jgi:hypothetical protein